MPDGSIVFSTELDNKKAQQELNSLSKKIDTLNRKIYQNQNEKLPLVEQSERLVEQLDSAQAKLEQMKNTAGFSSDAISEQKETVKSLQAQWNAVQSRVERLDSSIKRDTDSVDEMRSRAGELSEQLAGAGSGADYMSSAVNRAEKHMNKFINRLNGLARRVFVFTMITAALRSVRSWLGSVIKTSPEATAAIAKLKGALLTMAQPLVNVIIPAFTAFVNVLTQIVSAVSSIVSTIFGTTVEQSAKAAENLYDEQQALKGVGSAAKKAGKNLASFDEINKLTGDSSSSGSSSGSGTIKPDFSEIISSGLDKIIEIFTGAALLAVGAILTFTGAHVFLGIALMAIGAATIYDAITSDNGSVAKALVQTGFDAILEIVSGMIAIIGVILIVTGNILLGVSLVILGIALFNVGAAAGESGDFIQNITRRLTDAAVAVGPLIAVLGVVLIVTGHLLQGISLLIAGISIFSVGLVADQGNLTIEKVVTTLGAIATAVGAFLAVLGVALIVFGKVAIGLGLLIAGISLFGVGQAAINYNLLKEDIVTALSKILNVLGKFRFVLGLALLFVPGMMGYGFGMMAAGVAAVGVSEVLPNWDAVLDGLKGAFSKITNWWSSTVLTKLDKAKQDVKNWGSGVIDKIKEVFGINSPSTEMYSMGDYMMQGMENGITENSSAVSSAFQLVLDALQTEFDAWNTNFIDGFTQFEETFSDRWKTMWSNANIQFVKSWNNILDTFQNGINSAIDALNELVREANALAGLTGARYKYAGRISVQKLTIPKLAQGAVIPPNKEFMAVLGDQKQGTNIETPLATMVQAFKQALSETGYSGGSEAVLMLDRDVLGKVVYRLNKSESNRIGVNLTEV